MLEGIDRLEVRRIVTEDMLPGHLPAPILSTPALVALVEEASLDCVKGRVAADETTVGVKICITHKAVASQGDELSISVRLRTVNGRRLGFDVEVRGPAGLISEGTHDRVVVPLVGFGASPPSHPTEPSI
jgi:fluoroacetyl-CoA thioesterase